MDLEMEERDLTEDDFAAFDEIGSDYILSFFAMSDKAAVMLFVRYYAHLITSQSEIENIGASTMMEDGKKLLENLNLSYYATKEMDQGLFMHTYRETLPLFLTSEKAIKMIFSKQECPEE